MTRLTTTIAVLLVALVVPCSCTTYQTLPPRVEPYGGASEALALPASSPSPAASAIPAAVRAEKLSEAWVGSWSYFDQGPKIGPMIASAGYALDVRADRTARFSATGYQTDAEVECDVEEVGEVLRVIARRNLPGEDGEQRMSTYPPGKLLLVLRRARGEVATTWEAVTPAFEGCATGKVCFMKDK